MATFPFFLYYALSESLVIYIQCITTALLKTGFVSANELTVYSYLSVFNCDEFNF